MTGAAIESHTPTYGWTTTVGAVSSIIGLIVMAVCIYASVTRGTEAGYAPIPNGLTALACAMTLGGLVLLLFRILHAGREAMMRRLEAVDRKLNNVWGIAAVTSIEAQPPQVVNSRQQHTRRRGRRGGRAAAGHGAAAPDVVSPPTSLEVRRAARRLLDQVEGREGGEDNREDRS